MAFDINHPHWPWRNRKGKPIPMEEACAMFRAEGNALRTVGKTRLGPLLVSTVFLVVPHPCWRGDCPNPDHEGWGCGEALYETMIFCEEEDAPERFQEWDQRQVRYHNVKEAIEGHARVVEEVSALVR